MQKQLRGQMFSVQKQLHGQMYYVYARSREHFKPLRENFQRYQKGEKRYENEIGS